MSIASGRRGRTRDVPTPAAFREQFDEPFSRVLEPASWREGRDPAEEYRRIEEQVSAAVAQEGAAQRELREQVLPVLASASDVPEVGLYAATPEEVVAVQQGMLFNGGVEACDGTSDVHDTLAATIYQLGVALVSYGGQGRTLQQQLFRRDLRRGNDDAREAVLALLERRERRAGMHAASADGLSELARRGVMTYMERYVLTHEATAPWRMGHGSPAPMELVGMGFTDLVIRSIRVIRALVEHERFVFVSSEQSNRALFFVGQALRPLEYAVIDTLDQYAGLALDDWEPNHPATEDLYWDAADDEPTEPREWVRRFRDEVASKVVYGLYKATPIAPPQLFYAHRDHVHVAARLALADSVGQELRGFPMLIDLADRTCATVYGGASLHEMADAAYARAGATVCYQSERHTRAD